jgi:hypothetical protein
VDLQKARALNKACRRIVGPYSKTTWVSSHRLMMAGKDVRRDIFLNKLLPSHSSAEAAKTYDVRTLTHLDSVDPSVVASAVVAGVCW